MGFGGDPFFGMKDLSLGQAMFMGEAEGQSDMVDTDEAHFNAALKQIKQECSWAKGSDIDLSNEIDGILYEHGLSPTKLSKSQIKRIQRAVA